VSNILEGERAEFLKREVEAAVRMVSDDARDTYSAWRALSLKPGRYIHAVAMQVRTISNNIADVYANAKPDGPFGGLIAIIAGHLLLDTDRAAHCPIDAIEHDEQGVTTGLNNPPAMLVDSWADQSAAQPPKSCERSYVIPLNQAAVADHVGIDHGNQLPAAWRPSDQVQ
jgi:hypothetical protein